MTELNMNSITTIDRINEDEKETALAVVKLLEGMTIAQAESFLERLTMCLKRSVKL